MKSKILIVEDNELIRENTIEILELNDYTVFAACNGQEGLQIALAEVPELILCDIRMPVMDGYHLLEHIRKIQALDHSHFIFLTSACEKTDIEKALLMGADDYIVKPYSTDDLLAKLEAKLQQLKTSS